MTDDKLPLQAAIIPVTPLQQNCTLLWCTQTNIGVVIDPGGDVDHILEAVEQTGFKVSHIVLTHGHIDHAGGAMELKDKLGVEIIGPQKDDKFLLDSLAETAGEYGMSGVRNCVPDRWLSEGETLEVGAVSFEIFHCPGHSPGSLVFVNQQIKLAVVGDVLFQNSIGRTDLPGGNHQQLLSSIKDKLFKLDDDVVFICGHGPASRIGDERKNNPFVGDGL